MALIILLITLFASALAAPIERIPITADFVNSTLWVRPTQIVGGTPVASATDFPFMAAFMDNDFQFCGASIIGSRWAVTAAHCVGALQPNTEFISVGSLNYNVVEARRYKVERAIPNPDFNFGTLDSDIALLYLATEIEFSDTVQPVKLAPSGSGDFTGDDSTIIGWGVTTEGGRPSDHLREVDVPVISNVDCDQYYDTITDSMLCAYITGGGKDSCQGDSGGPALVRVNDEWLQVGIVSWGIGCARPNYPGVYSRVSYLYSWVCANTNGEVC